MADTQMDLEDWLKAHTANNTAKLFKKPGNSSRAAQRAAIKAPSKKAIILAELAKAPATPEQIWHRHGGVLNTWRARCSDLQRPRDADGKRLPPQIVPTGRKGPAEGGGEADEYRLTTEEERASWRQ